MSIDTTIKQAAARDAEAAWQLHRKLCAACGSRRRGPRPECSRGPGLAEEAARLRGEARAAAAADRAPGQGDAMLPGLGL